MYTFLASTRHSKAIDQSNEDGGRSLRSGTSLKIWLPIWWNICRFMKQDVLQILCNCVPELHGIDEMVNAERASAGAKGVVVEWYAHGNNAYYKLQSHFQDFGMTYGIGCEQQIATVHEMWAFSIHHGLAQNYTYLVESSPHV